MPAYSSLTPRVRIAAGALAVMASALLLGGQLSLFDRVASNEASVVRAKANPAPAASVAGRSAARPASRG